MQPMTRVRQIAFAAAMLTAVARPAAARPAAPRPLGGLTVYADDQRPGLFYYGPGELALVLGEGGRPDFHFMQARYTGSAVTADRGRLLHRSLLSFRVAMQAPGPAELQAARAALGGGRPVELRPLPIQRVDTVLVYAPVGASEEPTPLPAGHFEEAAEGAPAGPGSSWTTRSYSLGLDAVTSELFWGALMKGQVVLSVSYSFHAAGPAADGAAPGAAPGDASRVVRAGAFAVSVDAARWPELFRRVDIGERVPPDYPLLDVYCYDFRDALHEALYEKQVEVEAEGVGGRPVSARARFGRDQPDLYARGIRFGVAVRLDRPYRYRVTEVHADGRATVSSWRPRASWAELLDITTPREAAAADVREGEER
jgi:hypothetical protein